MPLPRRPLAFSLRTLLVLVGLACAVAAWLAHERRIVLPRLAHRAKLESEGKVFGTAAAKNSTSMEVPPEVRWSRRLFGDESIQFIMSLGPDDYAWHAEAREVFPEARFLALPTAKPRKKKARRAFLADLRADQFFNVHTVEEVSITLKRERIPKDKFASISRLRHWFGDVAVQAIAYREADADRTRIERAKTLFPEALVRPIWNPPRFRRPDVPAGQSARPCRTMAACLPSDSRPVTSAASPASRSST